MFFARRLPAQLRPPLAREERVVAWARAADGSVVVATNLGLFLPGAAARLGWHEIHKAVWTGRELVVTPAELVEQRAGYVVTADRAPVAVILTGPRDLPRVVRSRVTRSVSYSSHRPVPGGGVLVVARRVPGLDGWYWAVRYDPGTDLTLPGVQAATDQLVTGLATAATPAT